MFTYVYIFISTGDEVVYREDYGPVKTITGNVTITDQDHPT